ncbi:WAT1-related protein [Trifolium medium]|uniref:WAT1-related protein n=1 Tax=Trifolium medium TaxID=97028 RepID=A0A392PPW8_9FABA|nr:WAT1-related protein [Trifolium medium]
MKGPLYVSAFSPLLLVLVAFIASLVLDEYITVGSLTGATLIVCGLYMLLWGKSKEARQVDNNNNNMNEIASVKDPDKCDSIHIANSSLTCIQKDHDKNTLGEV